MADNQAMRLHPVPGEIVREWIIPAKEYSAFTMRRGQTLRFAFSNGHWRLLSAGRHRAGGAILSVVFLDITLLI